MEPLFGPDTRTGLKARCLKSMLRPERRLTLRAPKSVGPCFVGSSKEAVTPEGKEDPLWKRENHAIRNISFEELLQTYFTHYSAVKAIQRQR